MKILLTVAIATWTSPHKINITVLRLLLISGKKFIKKIPLYEMSKLLIQYGQNKTQLFDVHSLSHNSE